MKSRATRRRQGLRDLDEMLAIKTAVMSLYRIMLKREPEDSEVDGWLQVARSHGFDLVVAGVIGSEEFEFVNKLVRPINGRWSRSQYGEVEILLSFLSRQVDPHPTIVEVGAAGLEISNSIDLIATMGWRGLLIEASPPHARVLEHEVKGLDATVVQCAIDAEEGDAVFFVAKHPHLSSLSKNHAESWGSLIGEITVPRRRLANVLEEHHIPSRFTVLSIDIEGLDFVVLNDLIENSPYRPQWVIIEWGSSLPTASMDEDMVSDAVRAEYQISAKTFSNVFLRHTSVALDAD